MKQKIHKNNGFRFLVLLIVCLLVGGVFFLVRSPFSLNQEQILSRLVFIQGETTQGQGIFINSGWILTNKHVVPEGETYSLRFRDSGAVSGSSFSISYICRDQVYDLALLRVSGLGVSSFTPLRFSFSPKEPLFAYFFGSGVVTGSLVDTNVSLPFHAGFLYTGLYLTSFSLEPGDSGSPIFDRHGNLVALHTATNYVGDKSYAIPLFPEIIQHICKM